MELTSANVHEVFVSCLFKPEEVPTNELPLEGVLAHGITINVGFHPERLKARFEDIKSLLSSLPPGFMKGENNANEENGGWSFIYLVNDKEERQWGEQANAQELLLLGLASNLIKYAAERTLWHIFPGNVPYLVVDLTGEWTNFTVLGADKFDVWRFFDDGIHEKVLSQGTAHEAINAARAASSSEDAKTGVVKSVTITDSLDFTVYEWQYGKGIVFPPAPEESNQENFS